MEPLSMYAHMQLGIVHFKAFPEVARGEGPVVETLRRIVEDAKRVIRQAWAGL